MVRGAEIASNFGPCQHFRSYARGKYLCMTLKEDSGTAGDINDNAYIYLTEGSYPVDATSNDKRLFVARQASSCCAMENSHIKSLRGA